MGMVGQRLVTLLVTTFHCRPCKRGKYPKTPVDPVIVWVDINKTIVKSLMVPLKMMLRHELLDHIKRNGLTDDKACTWRIPNLPHFPPFTSASS